MSTYTLDGLYEQNKELFLKGIENGEQLLAYIEEGKNKELLDEIEPVNIRKIAAEKSLTISNIIEYNGDGVFKLSPDLNENGPMETMLHWFIQPYSEGIASLNDNDNLNRALRMIDVLVRLYGKKELDTDELKVIVDNLELCTKEEAIQRFTLSQLSKDELYKKLENMISDPFIESLRLEKLEEIYRVFKIDSKLFIEILVSLIKKGNSNIDEDILAAMPSLADEKKNASGFDLLAIGYIVNKYLKENRNDQESVSKLIALYEKEIFNSYFAKLVECTECSENIDPLKDFIEDSSKSSVDEVYNLIDNLFYDSIEDGKEKGSFDEVIFEIIEDFTAMMASMLYMGEVASTDLKLKLKKAFEIIFTVYPGITVNKTMEEFSKEGLHLDKSTPEDIETYCKCLKTLGFDEKYDFFVKLTVCLGIYEYISSIYEYKNDYGVKEYYFSLLDNYKNIKDDPKIVEAIELLSSEFREKFFENISQFENKNKQKTKDKLSEVESLSKTNKVYTRVTPLHRVVGRGILDMDEKKFYLDREIKLGSYLGCAYYVDDALFEDGKISIDILVKVEVEDENGNVIHTDQWPDKAYKTNQNLALFLAEAQEEILFGIWKFTVSFNGEILVESSFPIKKLDDTTIDKVPKVNTTKINTEDDISTKKESQTNIFSTIDDIESKFLSFERILSSITRKINQFERLFKKVF